MGSIYLPVSCMVHQILDYVLKLKFKLNEDKQRRFTLQAVQLFDLPPLKAEVLLRLC